MIHRVSSRALAAAPSLLVVAGFFGAAYVRSATPKSLEDALGVAGPAWMVALIGSQAVAGVLEVLLNPSRPKIRLLRAGIAVHIICAVTLAGYAVGLIFGASTPLITIGLALAASTVHLGRWRRIVTQEIPLAEIVAEHEGSR